MGLPTEGLAQKLGTRFEILWAAKYLLLLSAERVRAVQVDAVGTLRQGVDLTVIRRDGCREIHQCKAFDGDSASWTLKSLQDNGVLQALMVQLQNDPDAHFFFVSTTPARVLEDLSRLARNAANLEDYAHLLTSVVRRKNYSVFCQLIGLNPETETDRLRALNILQRVQCVHFADDISTQEDLLAITELLLVGQSAESTLTAICDIALRSAPQRLTAADFLGRLEHFGVRKNTALAHPGVARRLAELKQDLIEAIRPSLAAGRLLHRPESEVILQALTTSDTHDVIVLSGGPGMGKSGILYEVLDALNKAGVNTFAIRLDQHPPTTSSARTFGIELDLPASPVVCVRQIAADLPAVLILDQLDALRWTNAHSSQGMLVCKHLLQEVITAKQLGARLAIIFACRSFDLAHDPQIQQWLSSDKSSLRIKKVEVQPLELQVVDKLVEEKGVSPESLRPSERRLLGNIGHLAMWLEIVGSEGVPPRFATSYQLMRRFWENRRRLLADRGCDPERRDRVVDGLAQYMEQHASLAAPLSLLLGDDKLITELQSCGIISVRDRRISFFHQSFLDFQIADAVVRQIINNNVTVSEWLGPKEHQSLFRREPLRQVLFLLQEDLPEVLVSTLAKLLKDHNIRFHLQQLALEAIPQLVIQNDVIDLVANLLELPQWKEHVSHIVVHGNREIITELEKRGLIVDWLTSADEFKWRHAAYWIASIKDRVPGIAAVACAAIREKCDDWPRRIGVIAGHDGHKAVSDDVFTSWVACLAQGADFGYVDWASYLREFPDRVLLLFKAIVMQQIDPQRRESKRGYQQGYDALQTIARRKPLQAWKELLPCLKFYVLERAKRRSTWRAANPGSRYWPHNDRRCLPKMLLEMLVIAGQRMVRMGLSSLIKQSRSNAVRSSKWMTFLFVEILSMSGPAHADEAVYWILEDQRRFYCGGGKKANRWSPARRFIRRISRICSDNSFRQLQDAILKFRDPEERRLASWWLREAREGWFKNRFSAGQRFLLEGLDRKRMSVEALGRLGVLQEKFRAYSRYDFLSGSRPEGGFISSPVDDPRRYLTMSDKSWLDIVGSSKISRHDAPWRRQRNSRRYVEASVEMFSRTLQTVAEIYPKRFASLYLRFPPDCPSQYRASCLSAFRLIQPNNSVPEDSRDEWTAADAALLGRILSETPFFTDPEFLRAFCWLIHHRDDVPVNHEIIRRVLLAAESTDPQPRELAVDTLEDVTRCTVDTLETNAINCTRGVAATAIAALLRKRPALFSSMDTTIERLLTDDHAAVRCAAVQCCGAIWSQDPAQAVRWLCMACEGDERIGASNIAHRIYNHAFPEYADQLVPLVAKMLQSPSEDVAEEAATQVAARWLYCDLFRNEVQVCMDGSAAHRRGIAKAFSQLVFEDTFSERCLPYLEALLDDPDEKARHHAQHVIYEHKFWQMPWAADYTRVLVESRSGDDDERHLLWDMSEHATSVQPFAATLFAIFDRFLKELQGPERGSRYRDVDRMNGLLLRLYDQANGTLADSIRQRCLDKWDELMRHNTFAASSLTRGMDDRIHGND